MKAFVRIALFILPLSIQAQTTTNTNCNTSGNTINCNSTTYNQPSSTVSSQTQQQNYQAGQQIGSALGGGLATMMQRHKINKYCKQHRGEQWVLRNSLGQTTDTGVCAAN